MRLLKRIFKTLFKVGLIGFITLVCFEICYRYNVIDFYKTEILALNSKKDLEKKNVDILVFGDSFSATSKAINYVDRLRNANSKQTILNFSIPGTGIKQVNTFAASKIKTYKPKIIIYQIYVGNDLLDVEKFKAFNNISFPKYAFWQLSNTFLSLAYLNHKANVFKSKVNYRHKAIVDSVFNKESYNRRSKDNININSNYIEETTHLNGVFKAKYTKWLKQIKQFLNEVPKDTEVYFLWIPHCSQVNTYYLNNFKSMNAIFNDEYKHLNIEYSFLNKAREDLKSINNLHHLNLLRYFKTSDTLNKRLYYANDPHLNIYGNYILFKCLNDFTKY
mgnify:CR=1 FL=1|tara:strand:- start:313 stop:1311 length:999 start_codon:yes stop_codon:yes gene_type:complete